MFVVKDSEVYDFFFLLKEYVYDINE